MTDPILTSIDIVIKEINNDNYSNNASLNLLTREDIERNLLTMVKSIVLFI